MQTEQEWATKLKKLENDRDKALAAKDALLQQAMQRAQAEAQSALERLRSDSTAEIKRLSVKHDQEMSTLKVTCPSCVSPYHRNWHFPRHIRSADQPVFPYMFWKFHATCIIGCTSMCPPMSTPVRSPLD